MPAIRTEPVNVLELVDAEAPDEPEYLQAHLEMARDFDRRAAAAGDAVAVIIG